MSSTQILNIFHMHFSFFSFLFNNHKNMYIYIFSMKLIRFWIQNSYILFELTASKYHVDDDIYQRSKYYKDTEMYKPNIWESCLCFACTKLKPKYHVYLEIYQSNAWVSDTPGHIVSIFHA